MTRLKLNPIVLIACFLASVAIAPPAVLADDPLTVEQWSKLVWESARQGDRGALNDYLHRFPNLHQGANAQRVHDALEQHHGNARQGLDNRNESRADAMTRMRDHLKADQISQSLTAAVETQTLSDDLVAALEDPEMAEVIARARDLSPVAQKNADWLFAYELLYRLNVLYEHTGEFEEELGRVNRRLALLSYYAPRRLHELRNRQAERFGEPALPEFNPALTEGWEARLEGMSRKMVRDALWRAANDHIEDKGWRPLLEGGLEGLKLFATTPALAETNANLRDAGKVRNWVEFLDGKLRRIKRTPDSDLTRRTCVRLLDDLVNESRRTIDLPREILLREFGDGAMNSLDQFSEVIWPDKYHRFRQSTHGSFVGVGILIRHDEKRQIMVVTPLEGSPAYYAGIKPSDRIAEVDGGSTSGWSLNDAVDRITGRLDTKVTLGIRREGVEDLLQIPIIRDEIKIWSVKGWKKEGLDLDGRPIWDWYIDPASRIAYVRLSAFNERTYEDLKEAWHEIQEVAEPEGLILDLRYNPGGLLTAAVEVSNMFIPKGVIVSGENKDGRKAWPDRMAEPKRALIGDSSIPTVVLINQGSASASEIVAGSLQAHGRAIVVGMRSFGKGSVQTVHPISQRVLLKLTTQYYRLPARNAGEKGRLVHRRPRAKVWGVDPDIEVNTTPQEIKAAYDLRQSADILPDDEQEARPDINDLLTKGLDPQLETALLILQVKALGTGVGETRHATAN